MSEDVKNIDIEWKLKAAKLLIGMLFVLVVTVVVIGLMGNSSAKSVYVISDIAGTPTPVQAYDVQPAPIYLDYQATDTVPRHANGAVGVAVDTDSATLFITYETSNTIQLVDATTMTGIGSTTAPGAYNLAGIVVDEDNSKVYTVDRNTDNLYIYSWNAVTKTLTLDSQEDLPGVTKAHGLALDEVNDLLYVGEMIDNTVTDKNVDVFNTGTWTVSTSYGISQRVQGIAVDIANNIIYAGHAGWTGYGTQNLLIKYDMTTNTETSLDIRTLTSSDDNIGDDSVVGLAVDQNTGLLYITTGNQGSEGRPYYDDTDMIMVFDKDLNLLHNTGDIGNPTGLVIEEVSYNPLSVAKVDDVDPTRVGGYITYTISYDNLINTYDVHNVEIVDTLPLEVSFVSATGGGTYNGGTHKVGWNLGTLPAGATTQTVQVTVSVVSGAGTTITNYATIDSLETGPTTADETTAITANQPPVADINGPYIDFEGETINLDGTGSYDPDGDPLTYNWDLDNDGFYDDSTDPTPTYTCGEDGVFTIGLKVSDGPEEDTDSTAVIIFNKPPEIYSTSYVYTLTQGTFSTTIPAIETATSGAAFYNYFSASSHTGYETPYESKLMLHRDITTDEVTLIVTHNIDFTTSGIHTGAGSVFFDFSGIPAGAYVAQSDDPGHNWGTSPLGAQTHGSPYNEFDLSYSAREGEWYYGDNTDGGALSGLPTTSSWAITITPEGFYNIDSWVYHYATGTDIALDMNLPVTISYTAQSEPTSVVTDEGTPITLGAFARDWGLDDNPLSYDFYWHDPYDLFATSSGTTPWDTLFTATHTFYEDGVYYPLLVVTDSDAAKDTLVFTVTVNNVPPTVSIDSYETPLPDALPGLILPFEAITFHGSFFDPGIYDTHTIEWDFGDGSPVVTGTLDPTHFYTTPGDYTVTLTVTDDDGGVGSATIDIHVVDPRKCEVIGALKDYVAALDDDAFDKNPNQRENAIQNKFDAVCKQISHEAYQGAINKLNNDIKEKMDGEKPPKDWIVDEDAQNDLCATIDLLVMYLETLL